MIPAPANDLRKTLQLIRAGAGEAQSESAVARGKPAGGGEAVPLSSPAVTFHLPMPPSVNAMFRNTKRGRAKTKEYVDWQMAARVLLRRQHVDGVPGRVIVILGFERASDVADVDNRVKAVLDLLGEKHGVGVIDDDRNVTALLVSWLPKANGLAHVSILPVQPLSAEFHPAPNGAGGSWLLTAPQLDGE